MLTMAMFASARECLVPRLAFAILRPARITRLHAMPLIVGILACLAIAYRFYSAFLAAKVAVLDDSRVTPAHTFNDGQNYHPDAQVGVVRPSFRRDLGRGTADWPGAGDPIRLFAGPVWIVVGVCLAGAVQDMLVLAASVRHGGRSLAEIARAEIGPLAGATASLTILFVVIIALSGLGFVVVKALGGEEIKLAAGTKLELPRAIRRRRSTWHGRRATFAVVPADTRDHLHQRSAVTRGEEFTIAVPHAAGDRPPARMPLEPDLAVGRLTLPDGVTQAVRGSSWGTFTIACTVPIALFIGFYMYSSAKDAWSRLRRSARPRCWPPPWPAIGFPARRWSRISQ